MAEVKVTFNDADAYERYMGRWSRAVGEKFLAWVGPPKNVRWLDVGCGTAAFTELIFKTCAPSAVNGIDPSPQQVAHAKAHVPRAEFRVADSMALPFKDGEFDIVASALVIHFIPDRDKGLREMLRVAAPGGTVAGYTWERSATVNGAPYGPMARGLRSIGIEPTESPTVPEAMADGCRAALERAGYADIDVTVIEATQGYRDFDEFWEVQTLTFHPVGKAVVALKDAERERLRDVLRKMVPPGPDGRISYSVRATSFKARKPR